jgi:FkbM family methyltransferase
MTNALLGDSLRADVDGLRLTGSIEHRGYLAGLRDGTIEKLQADTFRAAVTPGMTVVDAGAFLGWYSLLAGRAVGPRGCVHAFEPDPGNLRRLRRNITLNQLSLTVTATDKALSDRSGPQELHVVEGEPSQNSLFLALPESVSRTVECVRLDDYLGGDDSVDVLKIDVEGAEVKVLRGMRNLLTRDRPMTIFVECLPKALEAAGDSPAELGRFLADAGFSISLIDDDDERLVPYPPEEMAAIGYGNFVCRRGPRPTT